METSNYLRREKEKRSVWSFEQYLKRHQKIFTTREKISDKSTFRDVKCLPAVSLC